LGVTLPPVISLGGGKSTYFTTLPGAQADFSETLNLVRSGRRMLLRAQDTRPASFFVGERFPVSLALLSSSLNPVGFRPIISSGQFPTLSGSVFPRKDFTVGNGPVAVVAGDFNGDSKPDLVVANQTDNTISVLLGNGDGSFQRQTTINAGAAPSALVARDFNGDGKLDLAVVNKNDNNVSIFLGNGDGTFGAPTNFATGNSPLAIAAGDFNGDGFVDLAVVNQADNSVSILLGDGKGGFPTRVDTTVGQGPVSVAVGDFNGDNRLDVVVANQLDDTISILLGAGDGTFSSRKDLTVPSGPSAVAVANFDGDTREDIAVTSANVNRVTVLLGNGDGTFGAQIALTTGNGPSAVLAANFGLRGFTDLVVANQKDNTVSVYPGNGDATFQDRLNVPVGEGPIALAASDLTGINRLDLAVVNQTGNSVSVILNSLATSAAQASPQSAYPASEYLDLGLKVQATPRIHPDREVTLQLNFEIRDLSGVSFNGIPVISNRTMQLSARLKEDESTVISGILDREETRAITGAPALAAVPGVGALAGHRDLQKSDTELIIVITPRRVRLAPRVDHTIYAGRGQGTPTGVP
jgi:hypothetical protein